ncbi:unnamed protein product, partial [Prunus brigantina]
ETQTPSLRFLLPHFPQTSPITAFPFPSLLELFKHNIEELDLRWESYVDTEWSAYIGAFRYLRSLNLSDCRRLTTFALWPIAGISILIIVGYIEETQRKRKAPEKVGNGENGGGAEEDQQRQKRSRRD